MICFKNEHKSDQETYVALTRAFFTSLSPVRAALNYILAALLLAFGIYNLTAGETAWGIVMTAWRPAADCADAALSVADGPLGGKIRGRLRAV